MNSWRKGRDEGGWATPDAVWAAQLGKAGPDGDPPDWVTVVPRLSVDLEALMRLTAYDTPPDIPIRHPRLYS